MNFSDEIYKQKYLKYKMKYLLLQQKGGTLLQMFDRAKKDVIQFLDGLTLEEKKSICTTPNYVFDDCNNYLRKFNLPPNITKEQRHVEIEKIKDIMLNSQKDTFNQIRKIKYTNGDIYTGLLENGMPNGQGKMTYKNGDIYEGTFDKGIPEGKKEIKLEQYSYFGEVKNNKPNGYGDITFKNGIKYTGTFKNGIIDGHGIMTYINGDIYDGEFVNNKKDGDGIYIEKSGYIYKGSWDNDEKDGYFEVKTPVFGVTSVEEWDNGDKIEKNTTSTRKRMG